MFPLEYIVHPICIEESLNTLTQGSDFSQLDVFKFLYVWQMTDGRGSNKIIETMLVV